VPHRVIIDTNLLISHLLHPRDESLSTFRLIQALRGRQFAHVLPVELIGELEVAVQTSNYLRQHIPPEELREFVEELFEISETLSLSGIVIKRRLRDPRDDYLLTAAAIGRADFIVTGDRDLLDDRAAIDHPGILTAVELLTLLSSAPD
jgi:putative PIN family toxin of toxin-antitoxin system